MSSERPGIVSPMRISNTYRVRSSASFAPNPCQRQAGVTPCLTLAGIIAFLLKQHPVGIINTLNK